MEKDLGRVVNLGNLDFPQQQRSKKSVAEATPLDTDGLVGGIPSPLDQRGTPGGGLLLEKNTDGLELGRLDFTQQQQRNKKSVAPMDAGGTTGGIMSSLGARRTPDSGLWLGGILGAGGTPDGGLLLEKNSDGSFLGTLDLSQQHQRSKKSGAVAVAAPLDTGGITGGIMGSSGADALDTGGIMGSLGADGRLDGGVLVGEKSDGFDVPQQQRKRRRKRSVNMRSILHLIASQVQVLLRLLRLTNQGRRKGRRKQQPERRWDEYVI
jgi:hypothetical protein